MNEFFIFFSTIRWQDIADVTFNSYILFRLYALFQGTKAFRMLVGILSLWFFQEIAVYLGLIVTSLFIQGITAVSALIIIVVFSNEIRSVFREKNLKAILWGFSKKTIHTPVEIIAESVFEMAQKYCGALIVFPGKDDLKEVIQNGIRWDGLVSKEMVKSIFWYGNPVHDGAVVIQGGRVTEVGAILPLSKRNLPTSYGTRHRAAKGLTEISDALVVIVSEERGNVLAAKGPRLKVMYDKEELEKELRHHMGVREKTPGYIQKETLKTCIAALISVLFITSIWFGVTRGLNTLITLEVPLEFMNRDPGMKIVSTSINTVRVHLTGSEILIKSVKPEQVRAKVDLSTASVGYNSFPITKDNIALPPGILLTKVEPEIVEMRLEAPIQIEASVEYTSLPTAMEVVSASADKVRLHLSGAADIIKSLQAEQIRVKPDLSKAVAGQNAFRVTKDNVTLPPGISLRKAEPEIIEVKIGEMITKEVSIQANWSGKLNEHLILVSAKIHPEKISVMGNPKKLESLSTLYTEKIPLDKIEKSGKINVPIAADSGIKTAPGSADKVTVEYEVKERMTDGVQN
jgi:uncharacterized protein (TIGR00159 family)